MSVETQHVGPPPHPFHPSSEGQPSEDVSMVTTMRRSHWMRGSNVSSNGWLSSNKYFQSFICLHVNVSYNLRRLTFLCADFILRRSFCFKCRKCVDVKFLPPSFVFIILKFMAKKKTQFQSEY